MSFSLYIRPGFSESDYRAIAASHAWASGGDLWTPSEDPLFRQDQLTPAFAWILRRGGHPCILIDCTFVQTLAEYQAVYRLAVELHIERLFLMHLEGISNDLHCHLHRFAACAARDMVFEFIACSTQPIDPPKHMRVTVIASDAADATAYASAPLQHWLRCQPRGTPFDRRQAARWLYICGITPRQLVPTIRTCPGADDLFTLEWLVEQYYR